MKRIVRSSLKFVVLLGILFALIGCSASQGAKNLPPPSTPTTSNIPVPDTSTARTQIANAVAPGYLVRLVSASDSSINGDYRVSFEGALELPYSISLQTDGLSESELIAKIRAAYARYFRTTSDLRVEIAERAYLVSAGGLVRTGGRYLVGRNSSLDEVIGKAGGLNSDNAIPRYARIQHPSGRVNLINLSDYYSGGASSEIAWEGGDSIFIQSDTNAKASSEAATQDRGSVQVLGLVGAPGEYPIKTGSDFFYYLVRAQGPIANANLEEIEVIRTGQNGRRSSIRFSTADAATVPVVQGGDIIIVHPQDGVRTLTDVATVVSIITSIVLLVLI